jgi:lipopolysaccharide/colanic/teichoic acid biosynthesis glycosyltransferase
MHHRTTLKSVKTADAVGSSTADSLVDDSPVQGGHSPAVQPVGDASVAEASALGPLRLDTAADVASLLELSVAPSVASQPLPIPAIQQAPAYETIKRLIDVCGALLGFVVASPLLLLCAVLIKRQDGGPVLFHQERVGRGGKRFKIVKFRSMVVNAEAMKSELMDLNEHDDNRTFKILHDPRITRVGRFMRRMSLDELPQLWNVLTGEMSLVGPRPALPSEVALYEPLHMARLAVKPGLTCIWQVSGRSKLGFPMQMELDLQYIKQRGVWLDLTLIARTFPAVLFGEGAA